MAAKRQGKKKTQDVKRKKSQKKPQKKSQRVKQKQKRSMPQKMKKGQAKHAKAGTSGEEHEVCSPRLFAARILRQMPKVRMESKARTLMRTMLTDMYNHVATQVEATLSQKNEPLDITATDVQAALKEAMTKEMAKHVDEQPPVAPSECA